MKKIENNSLGAIDPLMQRFSYEKENVIKRLRKERIFKSEIEGDDATHYDLPLNVEWDENEYENYAEAKEWIQDKLQGERLENVETRKYIQKIFEESAVFLDSYLEIGIPKTVQNKIKELKKSPQNIVNFILLSYGNSGNNTTGIIICALLKIADAFHHLYKSPELQDLKNKTEAFSDFLAKEGSTGFKNGAALEKRLQEIQKQTREENGKPQENGKKGKKTKRRRRKKSVVQFSASGLMVNVKEIFFKTKTNERIIAKMLNKPDEDPSKIVKDGVRARIIVGNPEDKKYAIKWLKTLGYKVDKEKKVSSGEAFKNNVIKVVGKCKRDEDIEETNIEIQVSDQESIKKAEAGVYSHSIFENIQKFLILARLFGSISSQKMQKTINKLVKDEGVDKEALEEHFKKFFFKNQETGRWHSYDYEFRTGHKDIYSSERFDLVISNFGHDFWVQPEFNNLNKIPPETIKLILEKKMFPSSLPDQLCKLFIKYLKTKKGVPVGIIKLLEKQVNVKISIDKILKNELESKRRLNKLFADNGIIITLPQGREISQKIAGVAKNFTKEFWTYIEGFVNRFKNKQSVLDLLRFNGKEDRAKKLIDKIYEDEKVLMTDIESEELKDQLCLFLQIILDVPEINCDTV